ncbi:GAP family protein [Occultella kanbiaonis]|uniref:GAP family protein n=1 Tax=Occultella kanbiaonis TaxID=2675754 RepID=UPI0013D2EF43|nr:GAP family protein [Occultella kanbiaonis]
MNQIIGDLIPLAVGIAVSPVPIIAAIIMLMSSRARATSLGFLAGWLLGIAAATVAFVLLGSVIPTVDADAAHPIAGTITLVLGIGLVVLAVRQWRSRPADGEEAQLPAWMGRIDTMTGMKAAGLGFLLAAVNPKNLLLAASAGIAVSTSAVGVTVPLVVFVVVAASSVAGPVIASLAAPRAVAGPLQGLRAWLVTHNAAIMTVVLLTIGVVVIGKGLGNF